ncbi:MAG: 3-oxoacyl-ACP synthase III family protein, partial [Opitutales bacterium]
MKRSSITAAHYCLPPDKLTNEELEKRFGSKEIASVTKMSGILCRRIAPKEVTAGDLAFTAANRMLNHLEIDITTVDGLLFASQTPDHPIPPTSSILHQKLGLNKQCFTLDLSIGCPAFPYATSIADSLITSGRCSKVLVLMADVVSRLVNPNDRSLATLHGDGAAALLVESTDGDYGFTGFRFGAESAGWEHIKVPAGGARTACSADTSVESEVEPGITRNAQQLAMNGPAVFQFSISQIPDAVNLAMDEIGITMNEIDLVILHQANRTMLELIYKRLGIPTEKQFYYIENVGNMAAASSPVTLAEAMRQGKIKPHSTTMVVSFGNGLNWGISLHKWGEHIEPMDNIS